MRVVFDVDMADVIAFNKHYILESKAVKKSNVILLLICAVPFIISLIFGSGYSGFVFPILFLIFGIIYVFKLRSQILLRRAEKELSKPENINAFGTFEMEFNDEEIKINESELNTILKWNAIKRLDETPEYFFLYISSLNAYSIPKKKISANETEELNVIFKKYFPGTINTFKK